MPLDQIAVVVLTWNNRQYTLDCLHSLTHQTIRHLVYVVDNASNDGTAEAVAAEFPAAQLLVNGGNLGFAAGNNVGLRAAFAAGADAVLVLNNDTTLAPDALAQLVSAADAYPHAGIISPLILFASSPHHIWFAGASIGRWTGRSHHHGHDAPVSAITRDIHSIERATGCAMLVTRACFERIGGFDESLFMYVEDVEYARRARDAGMMILLAPQAVVYHHVSASVGGTKASNAVYYTTRNTIAVTERYERLPAPLAMARRLLIACIMLCYLLKPPWATARPRDVLQGYRDARRHRLGPRNAPTAPSPYYLRQDPRGAHMRLLALIPPCSDVLDVGCASGYLARLLTGRGCRVVGVEINPDAARSARAYCEKVYELSAEDLDQIPADHQPFEVILFGDVLEHLAHPEAALTATHRLLRSDGRVVLSVPNIAHYSVRLRLLAGRFNYTNDGLLDRTHLHFFTRQSVVKLARSCGFAIVECDVTQGSPLIYGGHLLRKLGLERIPLTCAIDACDLWLSRRLSGIFGFQHLLVLRLAREGIQ